MMVVIFLCDKASVEKSQKFNCLKVALVIELVRLCTRLSMVKFILEGSVISG